MRVRKLSQKFSPVRETICRKALKQVFFSVVHTGKGASVRSTRKGSSDKWHYREVRNVELSKLGEKL